MANHPLESLNADDVVLDAIPEDVEATVEQRDRWLRSVQRGNAGLLFLVSDIHRWTPGQTVRVAFMGGDAALHKDIADATQEITDVANIVLDFGFDAASGKYRTWSESDTTHAAEIRVSFDKNGYFSLVGTDSVDPNIGSGRIGGGPGQCSLNLGGFAAARPQSWRGTTRHEFLHAMSFHHSHQNMRGPCEHAFRWDDDAGYVTTRDARGAFVTDVNGRRPGIYTYLSGYPNFWDRAKVDHNLKTEDDPATVAGPFDRRSVMLYRFPSLFYKDPNSPCLPESEGASLSDGDKRGLQLLYPHTAQSLEALAARRREALNAVEQTLSPGLLGPGEDQEDGKYARHVAAFLRRSLGLV
jgi:hypothetical protein